MQTENRQTKASKILPLDYGRTIWTGGLWKERFDTCAQSTIPQLQRMFESKEISHVLENFKICAGEAEGDFDGTVFGDGDFYKWIEAAICVASASDDALLLAKIDEYIALIAKAQQPDGYLSTKQIIADRKAKADETTRMGDINDFEVYNFGHLFTTACVHKNLTGKDNFLEIAVKTADYLAGMYAKAAAAGEVQTAVCPSHYMGLMDMFRTTGDEKYFALAKQAVMLRNSVENGMDDNQDSKKLEEHDKIIGHAVRANYLYAGVSDICAEEDNTAYRSVLDKVWKSLTEKKMYITGGCGALYNGASPYGYFFSHQLVHQSYGYEYQLPNITAYNETCASVGGVFWAWRMFRLAQKAQYFDVLERMMLNTNLAAVSLDGKRFFYENMLRRAKKMDFELIWPLTRSEYILSYCCPPNIARLIAQSSAYAYAVSDNAVWAGIYGASRSEIKLACKTELTLVQNTDYPWNGEIAFTCEDVKDNTSFTLNIRVPAWAEKGSITVNGNKILLAKEHAGSYQSVKLENPAIDKISVLFDMPVRYTAAHNMVEETTGQVAVERGPIVYCCEAQDTNASSLEELVIDMNADYQPVNMEIAGREIQALEGEAFSLERESYDPKALYQTLKVKGLGRKNIRFIPYFAWDNRGEGEMRIWFPVLYS